MNIFADINGNDVFLHGVNRKKFSCKTKIKMSHLIVFVATYTEILAPKLPNRKEQK